MKKLEKLTLKDFNRKMQLIDKNDQKNLLGGTDVTQVNINGGFVISYDNWGTSNDYSVYYGSDGSVFVFDGVSTDNGNLLGSAYQLNGIHVGAGPTAFFDIGTMIHEYGHHLQQEAWGTGAYAAWAGANSAYGYLSETDDYYNLPTEQGASERGQAYMDQYYPNSGYSAEGLWFSPTGTTCA